MTAPLRAPTPAPPGRWPVAVLGATGAVGQTFVRLLANHPWFDLIEVAASERSAGKPYREAARWLEGEMPAKVAGLTVLPCDPGAVRAPVVFSALDHAVAQTAEPAFARDGRVVLSNAKSYRMEPDVPIMIAEVNSSHLGVLHRQRAERGWSGAIVTNGNCSAIVTALALAPLHEAFGIKQLFAATMQATSGAGYPGVPSLDILGNVIPFIGDEEPKLEKEVPKMLGTLRARALEPATFGVSAHCNRVPVEHGHTVCMSVSFEQFPLVPDAIRVMRSWRGDERVRGLPSAPEPPLFITDDESRPQPRRDVHSGRGMTVVVGRVRPDPVFDLRLVAMGHNVVRGAAGGSVLNAEVMATCGMLPLP